MEIGIRELKENLSEYLDRAARGEVVRVTDRGFPKVLLVAVPGALSLEQGIREKWLRAPDNSPIAHVRRHKSERSIQSVIDDDREQ